VVQLAQDSTQRAIVADFTSADDGGTVLPMHRAGDTFGPFVFVREHRSLARDGKVLTVGGRAATILGMLIDARGAVVPKDELIEAAWPGLVVEEANLTVQIAALRKALEEPPRETDWIVTVPRVGYRLVGAERPADPEGGGPPTIAVLPFENLSSDPEQAYFADGVVEDIATALSRFKTFAVLSRGSTQRYRGSAIDTREAARELGARYVLAGSIRHAGDMVRVNAQLVDGASGAQLWAERFEANAADIFEVQDRITETVIGHVEPRIRKSEIELTRRRHPRNLDAWGLCIRARPLVRGDSLDGYDDAIDLLSRALTLDATFAPALALAAWAHEKRFTFGGKGRAPPAVDDGQECLALAARALAEGPDDAEVLATVGWMRVVFLRDWQGMEELMARAVELNPYNLAVLNWAGQAKLQSGSPEEVVPILERAMRLSPGASDNSLCQAIVGHAYFSMRRFEEALNWGRRAVETRKTCHWGLSVMAAAYAHLGRMGEAEAALAEARAISYDTIHDVLGSPWRRQEDMDLWVDGLRKAGMPER
jgi:TolB-like protein/lambda repressor-like predicted transcriptional regulator